MYIMVDSEVAAVQIYMYTCTIKGTNVQIHVPQCYIQISIKRFLKKNLADVGMSK